MCALNLFSNLNGVSWLFRFLLCSFNLQSFAVRSGFTRFAWRFNFSRIIPTGVETGILWQSLYCRYGNTGTIFLSSAPKYLQDQQLSVHQEEENLLGFDGFPVPVPNILAADTKHYVFGTERVDLTNSFFVIFDVSSILEKSLW